MIMNREIIYRGKRCSDGEWVYGFYVESKYSWQGYKPHKSWIVSDAISNGGFFNILGRYAVKDDTVGQFTGQYDKNDKKIYEGDIVRWDKDQKLYVVEFRSGMFYASVEPCNPRIYGGFPLWFLCEEEQHCEIVGNRYDNTELLATK